MILKVGLGIRFTKDPDTQTPSKLMAVHNAMNILHVTPHHVLKASMVNYLKHQQLVPINYSPLHQRCASYGFLMNQEGRPKTEEPPLLTVWVVE